MGAGAVGPVRRAGHPPDPGPPRHAEPTGVDCARARVRRPPGLTTSAGRGTRAAGGPAAHTKPGRSPTAGPTRRPDRGGLHSKGRTRHSRTVCAPPDHCHSSTDWPDSPTRPGGPRPVPAYGSAPDRTVLRGVRRWPGDGTGERGALTPGPVGAPVCADFAGCCVRRARQRGPAPRCHGSAGPLIAGAPRRADLRGRRQPPPCGPAPRAEAPRRTAESRGLSPGRESSAGASPSGSCG